IYQDLTLALLASGHTIPTAHLAESNIMAVESQINPRKVYDRDMDWIRGCDVLIAEVSVPSHGVGYEIGFALSEGKPALCLYQEGKKISKMITGNPHLNLEIKSYRSIEDAIFLAHEFLRRKQLIVNKITNIK
ncbi:MAG: nucleoside 2-deoxyribosyltransferase, partial [Anaerolineales bacterium]|nr:nucleoside 2-deoxyribosyltransferase [Anaerolineales bacterium]